MTARQNVPAIFYLGEDKKIVRRARKVSFLRNRSLDLVKFRFCNSLVYGIDK